jgi:hypothetical protein
MTSHHHKVQRLAQNVCVRLYGKHCSLTFQPLQFCLKMLASSGFIGEPCQALSQRCLERHTTSPQPHPENTASARVVGMGQYQITGSEIEIF